MPIRAKRHPASKTVHARYSKKSRNVMVDIEKQPARPQRHYRQYSQSSYESDTDTEDDSTSSSSASSFRPMLNDAPARRPPRIGLGYRVPHRVMRWLCMGLLSFLVLFIIVLFRFTFLSTVSRVNVPLPKPSSKPPAWESFPFLKRYHGGIRTLVTRAENVPEYPNDSLEAMDAGNTDSQNNTSISKRDQTVPFSSLVFNPYPDYASPEYIAKYGEKHECFLDEDGTLRVPLVHHYPGVPRGFPDPVIGSNELLGIKGDVCFDRFGRLGPYGMGYSVRKGGIGAGLEGEREGAERVWEDFPPVDFRKVDWAAAQNRCMATNSHRFKKLPPLRLNRFISMPIGVPTLDDAATTSPSPENDQQEQTERERLPRTAFVLRTWHDYRYSPDDILYLRSLISELSLQSGGEYAIHFLVQVKDENLQIWADDETYERVLSDALPAEFRGMATLWSERQMALMYPGLEETWASGLSVHGVYRSTHMPMQYFAYQHPEYDYYWNWEMDARYTGHWYHLFDKVVSWAREQPRKGLWERNARFYVPSVQGTWEDFRQMVRVQTEIGTNSPNNMWSAPKPGQDKSAAEKNAQGDKSVWGPERPAEQDILEVEGEGIPPTTMEKDRYEWGVGEEADLIVFNPLFDPEGTTWALRDDVTGYDRSAGMMPPRRTAIITASRMSNKLLHTMHQETVRKRHTMFSEMWPASTALQHGFKAVSIPHALYLDRRWPTKYVDSVFNAGRNGASGGARTSVFGDREHNFRGTTWFYSAGFAPNLWRRWLGFKVDNDGGEQEELAGEGRMCLPPMLLHPIKDVEMIIDDGEQARD